MVNSGVRSLGFVSVFCALLLAARPAGAEAVGLADALRATLAHHPAVAGQQAQIAALDYVARGARSQRLPTLSAQAQQFAGGDRSAVTGDDLSQPAIFSVRQPLWSFGRIRDDIAVANADVASEQADLLRVQRQLLEATAVAYANAQGAAKILDAAQENLDAHQALLEQVERRVQGQLAATADRVLAATRVAQARAELQRARSGAAGAQEDLHALAQVPVDTNPPVPQALVDLPDSAEPVASIIDAHADVQVKTRQLGRAEAEIARARSSSRPTLYLQMDRLHDQPALLDDNQVSLVFEASLEGLGFMARNRRDEAVANHVAARHDLAATRVELRRELDRLHRERRLQTELVALQTQAVGELETLLASYKRQYDSGAKSWLDVLNVQRELFEQRRQLLTTRSDQLVYSLRLNARAGVLDQLAGVVVPGND